MANLSGAHRPQAAGLIDETWTKTNMIAARLGSRGERPSKKVPQGKWKTATPPPSNDPSTRPAFDGPINGERFHAYVEQSSADVEARRRRDPRQSGSHKGRAVRKAIRDVEAASSPKIPPDLNPIEQVPPSQKSAEGGSPKHQRSHAPQNPPQTRPRTPQPQERRIRVDPKSDTRSLRRAQPSSGL